MEVKFTARSICLALAFGAGVVTWAQEPGARPPGGRGFVSVGNLLAQQLVTQGDRDADAALARDELINVAEGWFDRLDPDRAGRVSQEEFLRRFDDASRTPAMSGGRSLNFFKALDADSDSMLTREEFKRVFEQWYAGWSESSDLPLTREKLASGIESVLPRTNLTGVTGREEQVRPAGLPTPPPAPVLSPAAALDTLQLVDGFRAELAASEPLIEDPIALSFDEDGRLYVLEMRSYQLDLDRTDEREPISRISRLEDVDGDGRFDRSTIFVDGLILPRALAAVHGGVMYVSDYQLYFAQDTDGDGRADRTELLDAGYGGGNVEHAPNGLMTAMDNWIYNVKSQTRYRWLGNTLVRQRTENRGQWGLTQDNYGRLLYNINNSQLLGDYAPPNYLGRNPNYPSTAGLNLFVATDQRVFSARMNTGVNRGYLPDVLDDTGRLFVFASSCSPVVYRGDNFPAEFVGNAFVADPAANLIKRNLVFDDHLTLSSMFAYDDREFLAGTDERFRPVNLYNGPDGTLWIVDLYRGIAQYSRYMTAYLRNETRERKLDEGIHLGRIYRVVAEGRAPAKALPLSAESPVQLVSRLSHANGWIRDTAQRLLVERGDRSAVPPLLELIANGSDHLGRIHALWALDGLFVSHISGGETSGPVRLAMIEGVVPIFSSPDLTAGVLDEILAAASDPHPQVRVAALRVAESLTADDPERRSRLQQALTHVVEDAPDEVIFQAALTAGNLPKPAALPLLARIATEHADQLLIGEAIVSGLGGWELQFLQSLLTDPRWNSQQPGRTALLQALANAVTREREPAKVELLLALAAGQSAEQRWRQHGLLAGIAAQATGRIRERIPFTREPAALRNLALADDPQTRERSEQIKALFSWPGHQSDKVATSAAPARSLTASEEALLAEGKTLHLQVCAGCHGANGEGLHLVAPPLANSEWVTASAERLIRITLHGIAGPVRVDGRTYQPPDVLPEMPPLDALGDEQMAAVLSYLRSDWGHSASVVSAGQVRAVRQQTSSRATPWTETELLQIK